MRLYHLYAHRFGGDEYSFQEQFDRFEELAPPRIAAKGYKPPWFFTHFEGDIATVRTLLKRRYVHLVEPVFSDETKWYEKYFEKQLPLSEGAAVNFPLRFLLFYHYDPRCHALDKEARVQELSARLANEHAFFTFREEKSHALEFDEGIRVSGKLVLTPKDDLNGQAFWEKLLPGQIRSNEWVLSKLLQSSTAGIYWGIKIYPRLGYDPSDFANFPHLHDLYGKCVTSHVPMLAHCSRGGMAIADYYNYVRYDMSSAADESY